MENPRLKQLKEAERILHSQIAEFNEEIKELEETGNPDEIELATRYKKEREIKVEEYSLLKVGIKKFIQDCADADNRIAQAQKEMDKTLQKIKIPKGTTTYEPPKMYKRKIT